MKVIFRIKWEIIISIALILTMIANWIVFAIDSNVYTLALAVLPTFMALIITLEYDNIKTFRHEVIKNWN